MAYEIVQSDCKIVHCTAGTQFTCFTGTHVHMLTPEELRARVHLHRRHSVYLLYWYISTNTDGGEGIQRTTPSSSSRSPGRTARSVHSLLALLLQGTQFTCFTATESTNTDPAGTLGTQFTGFAATDSTHTDPAGAPPG